MESGMQLGWSLLYAWSLTSTSPVAAVGYPYPPTNSLTDSINWSVSIQTDHRIIPKTGHWLTQTDHLITMLPQSIDGRSFVWPLVRDAQHGLSDKEWSRDCWAQNRHPTSSMSSSGGIYHVKGSIDKSHWGIGKETLYMYFHTVYTKSSQRGWKRDRVADMFG